MIAIRTTYQSNNTKLRESRQLPTVVVKSNTFSQITAALDELLTTSLAPPDQERDAMDEVERAIELVSQAGKALELRPRNSRVRRIQHDLLESKRLRSESVGEEPNRRVRILPSKF